MDSNLPITFADKINSLEILAIMQKLPTNTYLPAEQINLFKNAINELHERSLVSSVFKGNIDLSTPAPIIKGIYVPTVSGTYANFGGTIVDLTLGYTTISFDGTTYKKQVNPIDLNLYAQKTLLTSELAAYSEILASISSKNLFNSATVNAGFLLTPNNVVNPASTSTITAYIAVQPNTSYTISGRSGNQGIAFYQANKTWISDRFDIMNGTITTPANCQFLRMNVRYAGTESIATTQIELGSVNTGYAPYSELPYVNKVKNAPIAGSYVVSSYGIETIDQFVLRKGFASATSRAIPTTKNLFNLAAILNGFALNPSNSVVSSATSSISAYIPVLPNTAYYISGRTGNAGIAFYQANNAWISDRFDIMNGTFTTPSNCYFLRMNVKFLGSESMATTQLETGSTATSYASYAESTFVDKINALPIYSSNPVKESTQASRYFNNQMVKLSENSLTIVSGYSSDSNQTINFALRFTNALFAINKVTLAPKSGPINLNDFSASISSTMLDGSFTDLVGPYILSNTSFVGAAHTNGALATAAMLYYKVFCDGNEITNGSNIYDAKEVVVLVKNEVYNYNSLPTKVIDFYEYQTYKIRNGNIEVEVEIEAVRACTFTKLYGIQNQKISALDTLYVAHSAIKTPSIFNVALDFGAQSIYPSVEKAIWSDASQLNCISTWISNTKGLGLARSVQATTKSYLCSGSKGYHWLIDASKDLAIGEKMFYNGGYTCFKNLSTVPNTYAYIENIGENKFLNIDFARTETSLLTLNLVLPEIIGKTLTIVSNDSTLTVTNLAVSSSGLTIKSLGYGNIKLKI